MARKNTGLPDFMDPSMLHSFVMDYTLIIPFHTDSDAKEASGPMDAEQFMKFTHNMSDAELNQLLYQRAREAVEKGVNPPWPKDDMGALIWFQFNFITEEMRPIFPAIIREYLAHEPMIGAEFSEVPYARLNEKTWDDAFYFRIIAIMILAARRGSVYSRNFLISLYKVYYKQEYNRLKKLRKLTLLDLLNLHDEDCKRRGLPSGHATDGDTTFRDYVINKRRHEAGWTAINSIRQLDPVETKKQTASLRREMKNREATEAEAQYKESSEYLRSMAAAPDEPPLQPVAARLFIMCEMLRIPIDETCNEQALHLTKVSENMQNVNYLGNEEFRKILDEVVERGKEYTIATFPETADPFLYQTNEHYEPLEMAECVLWGAFRRYDRNIRLPYDSKPFDLPLLMARASASLYQFLPGMDQSFYTLQIFAMVQYLCECLCELMITRDKELNGLLHFQERKHQDEWKDESEKDIGERAEKLLKSMENLHGLEFVKPEPEPEPSLDPENADVDELRTEVERLKEKLAEKEAALAESEQKVIRQRALYEQEKEQRQELEINLEKTATERRELIALREYVYSQQDESAPELPDEATQEEMIRDLQDKNVAVLGGTERWARRMKRLFPKWKFISVDDDSTGGFNALESASYIYMYTSAMKHKQYYRAMNMIRKENKMLFYLSGTNTAENVMRFHRDLCR